MTVKEAIIKWLGEEALNNVRYIDDRTEDEENLSFDLYSILENEAYSINYGYNWGNPWFRCSYDPNWGDPHLWYENGIFCIDWNP